MGRIFSFLGLLFALAATLVNGQVIDDEYVVGTLINLTYHNATFIASSTTAKLNLWYSMKPNGDPTEKWEIDMVENTGTIMYTPQLQNKIVQLQIPFSTTGHFSLSADNETIEFGTINIYQPLKFENITRYTAASGKPYTAVLQIQPELALKIVEISWEAAIVTIDGEYWNETTNVSATGHEVTAHPTSAPTPGPTSWPTKAPTKSPIPTTNPTPEPTRQRPTTLAPTTPTTATPTKAPTNATTGSPTTTKNPTSEPTRPKPTTATPTTAIPTTTGSPTTGSPTTGSPTTGSPTTGSPTTGSPTTGSPTTGSPTTGSPTTGSPTTRAPITRSPTTGSPTTGSPTTGSPTTGSPTTGSPTTGSPTTGSPTTGSPTTRAPITRSPTTGSPTTGSPTTGSPTTVSPTTGSPTSAAPTTGSPTTGSPTTGSPTTGSPTTGSPTTGSPTTGSPTTRSPTTRSPTTRSPTTGSPTTGSPTTGSPTTSSPTTGSPTTSSPTTSSPTTSSPTTSSPTTSSPTTGSPTTGSPTTESPARRPPTTGSPTPGSPIERIVGGRRLASETIELIPQVREMESNLTNLYEVNVNMPSLLGSYDLSVGFTATINENGKNTTMTFYTILGAPNFNAPLLLYNATNLALSFGKKDFMTYEPVQMKVEIGDQSIPVVVGLQAVGMPEIAILGCNPPYHASNYTTFGWFSKQAPNGLIPEGNYKTSLYWYPSSDVSVDELSMYALMGNEEYPMLDIIADDNMTADSFIVNNIVTLTIGKDAVLNITTAFSKDTHLQYNILQLTNNKVTFNGSMQNFTYSGKAYDSLTVSVPNEGLSTARNTSTFIQFMAQDCSGVVAIKNMIPFTIANAKSSSSSSLSAGAITGIVIGGVVLLLIIAFATWYYIKRKRDSREPTGGYSEIAETE